MTPCTIRRPHRFLVRPVSGPKGRIALLATLLIALLTALLAPGAAHAQTSYRVANGDVLRVEVIEDETLNRTVLVSPDGRITFPLAGSVEARGRTLDAVRDDLVSQLSPNFANPPTVFVSLERVAEAGPVGPPLPEATIAIYVMGEVPSPGKLELSPGTTMLQAFAQMGGFSDFAATKRVQLRRRDASGAERIYPLSYDAIMQGTSPNGGVTLQEGDVILVPTRRLFE
jgi:polysaccharide export outer membrane protein